MDTSDVEIIRKFRWTLHSDNLIDSFLKKASFNFIKKKLSFTYFEVYGPQHTKVCISKWLDSDISNEKLYLTTYGEAGKILYVYLFTGLCVTGNKAKFNYKDSSFSERKIKLNFQDYQLRYDRMPIWSDFVVDEQKTKEWRKSVEKAKKQARKK